MALWRMLFERESGPKAYEEYIRSLRKASDAEALVKYLNDHLAYIVQRLLDAGLLEKVVDPIPVFGPSFEASQSGLRTVLILLVCGKIRRWDLPC